MQFFSVVAFVLAIVQTAAFVPATNTWTRTARSSALAASPVVDEVVEKLKGMTLLEASELVKAIEETFDVDASAGGGGMMMMAPAGGAAGGAEAEEEQTEFDVEVTDVPKDKKIAILKIVRGITGLGLKEAKALVDAPPFKLKEGVSKEEAADISKQMEESGAVCKTA
jgi:large subunit ribosomal protein L7/L12